MQKYLKLGLISATNLPNLRIQIFKPAEFRNCRFESFDEFTQRNPKEIQRIIEDYVLQMRNDEHPNTIPTHYYPIQSFLEMNDVSINFKKIRRLFPERKRLQLKEVGLQKKFKRCSQLLLI